MPEPEGLAKVVVKGWFVYPVSPLLRLSTEMGSWTLPAEAFNAM